MTRRKRFASFESARIDIALSCSECGSRNYKTTKVATEGAPALKLKKFCTHCNKHTLHIEGR